MDIMALLNCSINFVLFCLMSQQFRKTFNKVLRLKDLINKLSFGYFYRVSSAQVKDLINKLSFGYFYRVSSTQVKDLINKLSFGYFYRVRSAHVKTAGPHQQDQLRILLLGKFNAS